MPAPALSRRALLASTAGLCLVPALAASGLLAPAARAEAAPGLAYGWDPQVEASTEADVHVAPDGDDAAPGSAVAPVRSIARGVALLAARGTGSLALHAGLYREAVSLDALRGHPGADGAPAFRLHRFGRDRVTITAAEVVRGWQPCAAAELARFGLPPDAGLYVAHLPAGVPGHGEPFALNPYEAGRWCPQASLRNDTAPEREIFALSALRQVEFATEGDRHLIRAVADPALVGLDPWLLADARLLIYHAPNSASAVAIHDFDPARGVVRLPPDSRLQLQWPGKNARMFYALQNLPSRTGPGQWFFRRRADQGIDLYLRPRDAAALADDVEISVRDHCIDFGAASSVELFGLEAIRAGGPNHAGAVCIRRRTAREDGPAGTDLRLRHCRAGENAGTGASSYGGIYLRGADGARIEQCSVAQCYTGFGLFLQDCREAELTRLHIHAVSFSPARFYTLQGGILSFSLFEDTGWGVHANKFNFYMGSDRVLVYGVRTRNTRGYATWQRASRIHFAFCELDCNPHASNRTLVSQNYSPGSHPDASADGTGDPVPGSTFWYWNLSLIPRPDQLEPANALQLGPERGTHRHIIHNCRLHGGGYGAIYTKDDTPPAREVRSHNVYTGLSWWQTPRYGWRMGEAELFQPPALVNPSLRGLDLRAAIAAEIAPLFPTFRDWDRDIDYRKVDWSAPPIGASVPG